MLIQVLLPNMVTLACEYNIIIIIIIIIIDNNVQHYTQKNRII